MPTTSSLRLARSLSASVVLLVAAFGEEQETASDRETVPRVTAIAEVPPGDEEASLGVADGAFGVEELVLQADQPTVLHLDNADDRAYRFQIAEDLVTPTTIAAGTVTDVKFTTPNANRYEGRLLAAEGDEVLDTIQVIVQGPGGVQP